MSIKLEIAQKLSQSLRLTPQLRQAIKLLQLGRLDFVKEIEAAVLENPVLEEVSYEDSTESAGGAPAALENTEGSDSGGDSNTKESFEEYLYYSGQDSYGSSGFNSGSIETRDAREQSDGNEFGYNIAQNLSLKDHLVQQLRLLDLEEFNEQVLFYILGNLDANGALRLSNEEIAESLQCSLIDVKLAVELIQSLEPAGIAARDLKECLILQLDRRGMGEGLECSLGKQVFGSCRT